MKWNLQRLADAVSGQPFVADHESDEKTWFLEDSRRHSDYLEPATTKAVLEENFDPIVQTCSRSRLQLRMGLVQNTNSASALCEQGWMRWLKASKVDHHRASRCLADLTNAVLKNATSAIKLLHACCSSTAAPLTANGPSPKFFPIMLADWFQTYHELAEQGLRPRWSREQIQATVPSRVLHNHVFLSLLAELEPTTSFGNDSEELGPLTFLEAGDHMVRLLKTPFSQSQPDEDPDRLTSLFEEATTDGKRRAVQTSCGGQ